MRSALVAMGDEDCSVRSVGLSTLRSICGPRGEVGDFIEDLAAMSVKHRDAEVRAGALELIGQAEAVGRACGIRVATQALSDSAEGVRQTALASLRRLWAHRDPQAISTLTALILPGPSQSPDAMLRYSALDILGHTAQRGDVFAVSAAIEALMDTDSSVRVAAFSTIKHLCVRGDTNLTAKLLGLTRHRDA